MVGRPLLLAVLVGIAALVSFSGATMGPPHHTAFLRPHVRHAALWTKRASSSSSLRVAEVPEHQKQQQQQQQQGLGWRITPGASKLLAPMGEGGEKGLATSSHQQQQQRGAGVGDSILKGVKKAGAVGLAVVLSGIVLVGGLPVVAHAASATIADLTAGASSSYNSVMAKLAASGFLQAFSLVFVSEIGDKTFFIAGLLAMKTSRLISFTGSMAALSVMTVLSVLIGQVFHSIPQGLAGGIKLDQWAAVLAFSYFGLKILKEAYEMPDGDMSGIEEERAEAEKEVEESKATEQKTPWGSILQIFSLVFAAEFGDRSFLSTIALGAANNPFSVAAGAVGAHATATGIAVASGAFLSKYISEKRIGLVGGSLFIVFAVTTALGVF